MRKPVLYTIRRLSYRGFARACVLLGCSLMRVILAFSIHITLHVSRYSELSPGRATFGDPLGTPSARRTRRARITCAGYIAPIRAQGNSSKIRLDSTLANISIAAREKSQKLTTLQGKGCLTSSKHHVSHGSWFLGNRLQTTPTVMNLAPILVGLYLRIKQSYL